MPLQPETVFDFQNSICEYTRPFRCTAVGLTQVNALSAEDLAEVVNVYQQQINFANPSSAVRLTRQVVRW